MNFRRILTRKLAMVIPVMVMVALAIALVAVPAGAINQSPAPSGVGEVLNSPGPVPAMINYQGYLTDSVGDPINDTLEMTFSIYNVASGGTPVWQETHPSVTVTDGLFNVLLGSLNPINPSHLTGGSYLGVQVGADPEMTPRQQIVSVAYSFHADQANNADTLDTMDSADFVAVAGDTMTGQLVLPADGLVAGTDQLVLSDGNVGIGATTLEYCRLHVQGGSNDGICAWGNESGVSGFGSKFGVHGVGNYGVHGSGSIAGVYGSSSTTGVYGYNSGSGNYGQLGTGDYGVYGYGSGLSYGIRGEHSNGNYGILGRDTSGVYGASSSSYGVYGSSSTSIGVAGRQSTIGNYGQLGTSSYGVYGYHNDSGNYGYIGSGDYGVYGVHSDSGNTGRLGTIDYGVYGISSTNGYSVAGYNIDSGSYGFLASSDYGVFGSSDYQGVYGFGSGYTGVGVYGYGYYGVRGEGSSFGVIGYANSYDFYAAGPGTNYGPFTGAHEVKLADGFSQDFRPGLIVSTTGETQVRTEEGEISYSSTLPTVQLADTTNDIKVFGVIISDSPLPEDHWYKAAEGERFGIVNALGEGRVWVTNINGDIEAGHYITTSAIAGYGQKQDDDILHSYTLGKATETVDWSQVTETVEHDGQTYKIYPIAIVYTSG